MRLTNTSYILSCAVLVVLNILIGHFFAPYGILLSPIVILVITGFLLYKSNISPLWISILLYVFSGLNDVGLKLYAGGKHDYEGLGWMLLTSAVGVIPSYILMLVKFVKQKEKEKFQTITALIIFPLLIYFHLHYFWNLGIGRMYWYPWNG